MSFISVQRGSAPLIISLPHTGTDLPDDIVQSLVSRALAIKDTDWRIDALYAFTARLDATIVRTSVSRTAIDVNRDPSGASLYPGQATTGLIPVTTFDGEPLYPPGREPFASEVVRRRTIWFEPYHTALRAEIDRLKALHPRIVLYDCHSIRSEIPRLFPGTLPVYNIGTDSGRSCDAGLSREVALACLATGESVVLDGRFKGGWITRHYGHPGDGIHAIQMELAQRLYMDEGEPANPSRERFSRAEQQLAGILDAVMRWATRGT